MMTEFSFYGLLETTCIRNK